MSVSAAAGIDHRRATLVATWLSYAGFYFTRKVFGVVKAPLKEALGRDDFEISHLWTTFLVAYMVGQFASAALGQRFTSRQLLLWGMGASIATNVLFGLSVRPGTAAYVGLMILMAIHGLAQGTGWPHNVALVGNWTHRYERGTVMGLWSTCYQLGAVGGKALAAFSFGVAGIFGAFGAASGILLGIAGFFFVFAKERPEAVGLEPYSDVPPEAAPDAGPGEPREAGADGEGADAAGDRAVRLRTLARTIVAMGLVYLGFKFLRYAIDSWATLILVDHFQLSTSSAGYLSAVFDWTGFAGVLFSGWASDRFFGSRRTPIIFTMTAGALIASLLLWRWGLSSPLVFIAALGLVAFLAMGPDSLISGAGALEAGSRRQGALTAGVINGVGSLGPIIQEPAIGYLKTHVGLDAVLLLWVGVTTLATLGTALLYLFSSERRRSNPAPA